MKKKILSVFIVLCFCASAVCAIASQIDISDKVTWHSGDQMWKPNSYDTFYEYDFSGPNGERTKGGIYLDVPSAEPNKFDMYISLSALSYPDLFIQRVTLDQIPDHDLPYTSGDYGYEPDGASDPSIHYDFSAEKNGLGGHFLEWQLEADNPMPHNAVYPGSIYLDDPINSSPFYADQLAGLDLYTKFGGGVGDASFGASGQTVVVPELPLGAFQMLSLLFGTAFIWVRRFM